MVNDFKVTNKNGIFGYSDGIQKKQSSVKNSDADSVGKVIAKSFSINNDRDASDSTNVKISETLSNSRSTTSGVSVSLSNSISQVSILSGALDEITSLLENKKQLEEDLSELPIGEQSEQIEAQVTEIDKRISSIQQDTTFNGVNLFESGVKVNNTSLSNLSVDTSKDTQSQLELVSTNRLKLDSIGNELSDEVQSAAIERRSDSQNIDEETVSSLVQKIAGEITSPFNSIVAKQSIIESATSNLNPERVSYLTVS
jgi:flagellin-like hook-associated protein FlgL